MNDFGKLPDGVSDREVLPSFVGDSQIFSDSFKLDLKDTDEETVEHLASLEANPYLRIVSKLDAFPGFRPELLDEIYSNEVLKKQFDGAMEAGDKAEFAQFKNVVLTKYWKGEVAGEGDGEVYFDVAFKRFRAEQKLLKFLVRSYSKSEEYSKSDDGELLIRGGKMLKFRGIVMEKLKVLNANEDISSEEYTKQLNLLVDEELARSEDEEEVQEVLEIWQEIGEEDVVLDFEEEEEEEEEEEVIVVAEVRSYSQPIEDVAEQRQAIESSIGQGVHDSSSYKIEFHKDKATIEAGDFFFPIDIYKEVDSSGSVSYSFTLKTPYSGDDLGPYTSAEDIVVAAGKCHLDAYVTESIKRIPDTNISKINHEELVSLAENLVGEGKDRGYSLSSVDRRVLTSLVEVLAVADTLSIEDKVESLNVITMTKNSPKAQFVHSSFESRKTNDFWAEIDNA